jgi:hypothetical protein
MAVINAFPYLITHRKVSQLTTSKLSLKGRITALSATIAVAALALTGCAATEEKADFGALNVQLSWIKNSELLVLPLQNQKFFLVTHLLVLLTQSQQHRSS